MRRIALATVVAASLALVPGATASETRTPVKAAGITYCTQLTVGKICSTILNRKWMRVCTYVYSGQMVAKKCRKVRRR